MLRLYLDTSVIGGYFDEEFMADTRALWRLKESGIVHFVSSRLVFDELARAPDSVRRLALRTFDAEEPLDVTDEMEALAAEYLTQQVLPARFENDAQHVAVCSVARVDYLVSWNFKHLANERRETGFNAVNVLQGYPCIRIVSPTFLVHGYEKKGL